MKKEKSKQQTKFKSAESTMGSSKKKKTWNLGLKPITSSMKQVIQRDGWKTLKDTKPRRGLSCYHNCPTQDSGGLNCLKRYSLQNNEKYVLESFFQNFSMASKYIFQFLLQLKK
jgi:hypothetical protein